MEQVTKVCEKCNGEGEIVVDDAGHDVICTECLGWGYVKVEKTKQTEPEYYI